MEKFAFIIHPMDVRRDVGRKYPPLRFLPVRALEKILLKISPKIMSHITGVESATGARAEGWLIGCPLSPRQLVELPPEICYDRIVAAGRLAAEQGARIVGLGAFTSVAGDAGISVARRLKGVINVTSGNSYTVYTAIEGLLRAAELMETDIPRARAAIIGATGSIGAVCAKILARSVAEIVLVGRNAQKLESLRDDLMRLKNETGNSAAVSVATDVNSALREADLVLTVSASKDVLIYPEDLKCGAVVCDVARPRDVSRQVIEQRDDVLVIEGGVIEVPGEVNFNFNFGFPDKTAYACMSETMLMALEGTYEPFTLGRELTVEQVERIGDIARKHGFKLAGFRSFEKAVDEATIARVRANAKRRQRTAAAPKAVKNL
ncbi:MAG TPA: polysaccharide biosynthesis protein, partial [Abditibacteriaceae bacterium]|nr:polysaccharide biosynthesis protein [Abditibacteriaceae bacterium]